MDTRVLKGKERLSLASLSPIFLSPCGKGHSALLAETPSLLLLEPLRLEPARLREKGESQAVCIVPGGQIVGMR